MRLRTLSIKSGIGIAICFLVLVITNGIFSDYCGGVTPVSFLYDGQNHGTGLHFKAPTNNLKPVPIVIFVHGYDAFRGMDSRIYEFTRRGWDVLAIDIPGHGSSIEYFGPGCWRVIQGAMDFVTAHQDWWNISAIALVGHSFGGLICAMGVIFDTRVATSVLWAPLLDLESMQGRLDNIDPTDETLIKFTPTDSPLTYLEQGLQLRNTMIIQAVDDNILTVGECEKVFNVMQLHDPNNTANVALQILDEGGHNLWTDTVMAKTVEWLSKFLQAQPIGVFQSFFYADLFVLEVIMLFICVPAIAILILRQFVDFWEKQAKKEFIDNQEAGSRHKGHPVLTGLGIFSIIQILILFLMPGVNFLLQIVSIGLSFILGYGIYFLWQRWRKYTSFRPHSKHVRKTPHLIVRMTLKHLLFGGAVGAAYVLLFQWVSRNINFFNLNPTLSLSTIEAFAGSCLFVTGVELVLRRNFQEPILAVQARYSPRVRSLTELLLSVPLPIILTFSLIDLQVGFTPQALYVFFIQVPVSIIINKYVYRTTRSLIATITCATIILGWSLAGVMFP